MDFKEFFTKNKKLLVAGVISAVTGVGLSVFGSPTQEELNDYITKNETVRLQIVECEAKENTEKNELVKLQEQRLSLENEKKSIEDEIRIAKEEAERKDKEEKERIAKKEAEQKAEEERKEKEEQERVAKEEANRRAKEELEKKKQDEIAKADNDKKVQSNNSNSGSKPSGVNSSNSNITSNNTEVKPVGEMVWKTKSGSKYHNKNNCGKTDSSAASQISIKDARAQGLTPCSKCYK